MFKRDSQLSMSEKFLSVTFMDSMREDKMPNRRNTEASVTLACYGFGQSYPS